MAFLWPPDFSRLMLLPFPMSTSLILILHAASTWALAGVIWFIQIAHYPAYRHVDETGFIHYQAQQLIRTGLVVVPLMVLEIGTAFGLIYLRPPGLDVRWLFTGLALILVNWIFTVAVQAPLHARFMKGRDQRLIERLIRTNWLRTLIWSGRAVLVGWLLWIANQR